MAKKPILLLADSQNLFWQIDNTPFLNIFFNNALPQKAVYIGAANGDRPEYYEIFRAAMQTCGIPFCTHIHSSFTATDRSHLQEADLILLSGGDTHKGWQIIKNSGMDKIIVRRYAHGAYLIGISAGAIQIGLMGIDEQERTFETLKCIPMIIDAHQEQEQWERLKRALKNSGNVYVHGIGIPFGSGIIYHNDHTIESVRRSAYLFEQTDKGLKQQLILPSRFGRTIKGVLS